MPDHGTAEVVIRTARKVVAIRLVMLAVLFIAISLFVWIMVPEKYSLWAVGLFTVMWLYIVKDLLRLFVTGTAFVLTDRGLSGFGSVDFVAWSEIESARLGWHGAVEGIDLELRDAEAVLARLPMIQRSLLRNYMKDGGKPSLAASFGEGGAERLLELIKQRID